MLKKQVFFLPFMLQLLLQVRLDIVGRELHTRDSELFKIQQFRFSLGFNQGTYNTLIGPALFCFFNFKTNNLSIGGLG